LPELYLQWLAEGDFDLALRDLLGEEAGWAKPNFRAAAADGRGQADQEGRAGHSGDLEDAHGYPEAVSLAERVRATDQSLCRGAVRGRGRGDQEGGRCLMRIYTPIDDTSEEDKESLANFR